MLDSFPETSEISIILSFMVESGNTVRVKYVKQISKADFSNIIRILLNQFDQEPVFSLNAPSALWSAADVFLGLFAVRAYLPKIRWPERM